MYLCTVLLRLLDCEQLYISVVVYSSRKSCRYDGTSFLSRKWCRSHATNTFGISSSKFMSFSSEGHGAIPKGKPDVGRSVSTNARENVLLRQLKYRFAHPRQNASASSLTSPFAWKKKSSSPPIAQNRNAHEHDVHPTACSRGGTYSFSYSGNPYEMFLHIASVTFSSW